MSDHADTAEQSVRAGIVAGLREWAGGLYALEAAVELLIRFNHGRLLDDDIWIQQTGTRYCFLPDEVPLLKHGSGLSGGEHRMLLIATSLAQPSLIEVGLGDLGLGDLISGLDRDALDLVLAAIAHAGGSHEHSRPVFGLDGTYGGTRRLSSLHPWPNATADTKK